MSKTLSLTSMAIALAIPAFATTYYVNDATGNDGNSGTAPDAALKTIAKGVEKATTDGDVIEVAAGTYTISSQITVAKAITIRGQDPDLTTIDAQDACRIFNVTAAATIESLRLYRGKGGVGQGGAGACLTAGGTLCACVVDSCLSPGSGGAPSGTAVSLSGGSIAENCVIRNTRASINGGIKGAGVYIDNGILRDSIVTGSHRTGYADGIDVGAVYLNKGTVERCTIAGNTLATAAGLYVNNATTCIVRDTIIWGNVTTKDSSRLRPNMNAVGAKCVLENVCTSGNVGTGGVDANPCFVDAANGDFSLMPGSPCIGAGTNGRDIGCIQYDSSVDALGIKTSAYRGRDSLTVTATLSASGAYSLTGATVTWDELAETGPTITHTFGPGTHSLTANVTFADSSTASVTLPNAIRVTTGIAYIDDDSANPVPPYATPETAARTFTDAFAYLDDTNVVAYVAEGSYDFTSADSQIILLDGSRCIATGARDSTLFRKTASSRFFYLYGQNIEVSGFLMDGRDFTAGGVAGAIYMSGGAIVSNCFVRNCKSSTNLNGGGIYAVGGNITHCIVTNCMGYSYASGAGIYLSNGAILSDSVVAECGNKGKRTTANNKGGGVYLTGTDTKAVNCTIVNNTAFAGGGGYIDGNGPFVANCIIQGNDEGGTASTGSPDWYGTASRFTNCCALVAANGTCQTVSSSPVRADFSIDPSAGAVCINHGDNTYVVSSFDLFGNPRIVNGAVDIGAVEYASVEVVPGFQADVHRGVAPLRVVFSGSVQGLGPEGATFSWFFDGSDVAAGTGQTFTNDFAIGYHTVKVIVSKDGSNYATDWSAADYIFALPPHMHVALDGSETFPYDTPATAATNIYTVVNLAREANGVEISIGPGKYELSKTIIIDTATKMTGAGMGETILFVPDMLYYKSYKVLDVNSSGALIADLCMSNGVGQAGGVCLHGDGGHVTRCLITNCRGSVNQEGGGALVSGANSRLSRCVIRNCTADRTNSGGVANYGGGLHIAGGLVDDCLIIGNVADAGGGVCAVGGTLANCVIVGNTAWRDKASNNFCAGGLYAKPTSTTTPRVINCIVFGNTTLGEQEGAAVNDAYGVGYLSNCCLPSVFAGQGSGNVAVDDPQFKNLAAGDYRISGLSKCRNAGLYQSWMAGAVDFFGNSRARGTKVDIGYHQSEPAALTIFLQ